MASRILILGGGFAGLTAARKLENMLRPEEAEIVLVSRENYSLFTPMLPEVGSGNLETRHVVTPVRAQLKRSTFVLADVCEVDLAAKRVEVEHTIMGTHQTLAYDQLIFRPLVVWGDRFRIDAECLDFGWVQAVRAVIKFFSH